MLSILCFLVIAVLAVLALTRRRVFVICGFYSFYALLSVLDPENVPHLGPVTIYRAIYVLAFISVVARFAQDRSFLVQTRRWPLIPYLFLLVLIFASALYSQTSHTFYSEGSPTIWEVTTVLSLFLLAAFEVHQESDLKVMAVTTVGVSLVLSAWVIYNAAKLNFAAMRGGIEVNQNYVSQFVLAGGVPLVYGIVAARRYLVKLLCLILLLAILSGGLILASRGIFAAFAAACVWAMVEALRGRRKGALWALAAVFLVLLGVALMLPGSNNLIARFKEGDVTTLNSRTVVWSQSMNHFSEGGLARMIFGAGLSSPTFVLAPYVNSDLTNYHNQYLKYLMEQGVVGAVAFLIFLYAVTRRLIRSHHRLKPVMLGWMGFLIIAGLSSTIADSHQFWILLGVMMGVCALPDQQAHSAAPAVARPLRPAPYGFSSGTLLDGRP